MTAKTVNSPAISIGHCAVHQIHPTRDSRPVALPIQSARYGPSTSRPTTSPNATIASATMSSPVNRLRRKLRVSSRS